MEKMLITKIKRTDQTRADLFGKGHKWPDMKLFDLSELLAVGITPDDLPVGVEKPCRFLAHYTLSDKLNEAGNPYKDVSHLEAADNGNGTTAPPPMNDAMLAAILAELEKQTKLLKALVGAVAGPPEEGDWNPVPAPEPGPQEPPPEEESDDSILAAFFSKDAGEEVPTNPQALLEAVEDALGTGFDSVRDLHDALALEFGSKWKGWPLTADVERWREVANTAMLLADA